MAVDHIRYDILAQEALRGLVRNVLVDAAKKGLPGDHHFFITIDTHAEGVRLSPRLIEQYPEEMTVVLQHQFWDLKVTDTAFEVGLSFGGVPERMFVPFSAIKGFADPSVQFALQFETIAEIEDESQEPAPAKTKAANAKDGAKDSAKDKTRAPARTSVPSTSAAPSGGSQASDDEKPDRFGDKSGGEVVRLDRFRKK